MHFIVKKKTFLKHFCNILISNCHPTHCLDHRRGHWSYEKMNQGLSRVICPRFVLDQDNWSRLSPIAKQIRLGWSFEKKVEGQK